MADAPHETPKGPLYKARDLWLTTDKNAIWALEEGPMQLEFDDGEVIDTTNRETIFSWYLGAYHRLYPKTPLYSCHHLNGQQLEKNTHVKILGRGLFDCHEANPHDTDLEELAEIAYQVTNELYNDLTERLKPYVSTLSMFDIEEALHHPEIKASNDWIHSEEVAPTSDNIEKTHNRILAVLVRKGELVHNAFARMAKSKLVNSGQLLQILGPRGYVTDIDSRIFPYPILNGYGHGIYDLHDILIETRSAAKSHIFAQDPVAQSEYFNREMQLSTSIISRLHHEDCGTQHLIQWRLRAKDIKVFAGKYYECPTTGNLKVLKEDDAHLEGKTLRFRSVLGCEHTDPYGVCATCFGRIALSIPRHTNLGHVCSTVMCEQVSQNVLSTKHYEGSSVVGGIEELSDRHAQFITLGPEGSNTIMLARRLAGKKVKMLVKSSEAANLAMVDHVDDVNKLTPSQITEFTEVTLEVFNDEGISMDLEVIPVSHGSRLSSFTRDALRYVRENSYHPVDGRHYMIDLSNWDVDSPLFELPMKHPDMVEMMKTIKKFVQSNRKPTSRETSSFKTLRDYPTPVQGLQEFHQIISSKLKVNIAHLEVIVLSTMIQGPEGMNHFPPVPKYTGMVSSYNLNMRKRSEGVEMAYQGQVAPLTEYAAYANDLVRPDSVYDNLLEPFPVINPRE